MILKFLKVRNHNVFVADIEIEMATMINIIVYIFRNLTHEGIFLYDLGVLFLIFKVYTLKSESGRE